MRSKMQKLVLKCFLGFCKNMKGEHFSTSQVGPCHSLHILRVISEKV